MKLKKIKIVGFKSFADKVELIFDEELNGIVGPNGCGKSNIADAFRWVMGEQSAKSMRGGNMQDVIFAGTTKRKPLNLAEVTLTFDNHLGKVEIPYREVEITRRYHRNGDSEYLINNNVVRLKDVQALLIDIGMGKNAYWIFEQGKIDQVIQLNPEERRTIFESAAGISRFLMNEKETMRKLLDVDNNAKRLEDIVKEVAGQIEELQKQAEKAAKFKKLTEKLKDAEIEHLSNKINHTQTKKNVLHKTLNEEDQTKAKQEKHLHDLKDSFREKRDEAETKGAELKTLEARYFEMKGQNDVKLKEQETVLERIDETKKAIDRLDGELKKLGSSQLERTKEMKDKLTQEDKVRIALDEIKKAFQVQDAKFKTCEKQVAEKRDELIDIHNRSLKKSRESGDIAGTYRQNETRRDLIKEKLEEGIKTEKKLDVELSKSVDLEKDQGKDLESLSSEIEKLKKNFTKLDQEIKSHQELIDAQDTAQGNLRRDLVSLQSKEKTLSKLKEEMEGFSSGSKTLIKAFPELKKLYEYFKVQTGFENTCAALLKSYGDTLVAESEELLKKVLKYAKEKNITDFSCILLPKKASPFTSTLKEKVESNALVSHFLNQKGVVKDLEEAFATAASFEEVYTLDGFYIDRMKVISRGSNQGQNLFLRDAELKAAITAMASITKDLNRIEGDLNSAKEKKEIQQKSRRELDTQIREKEMRLVERNFQFQKIKADITRIRKTLGEIKEKRLQDEAALAKLEFDLKEQKSIVEKLEKEQAELAKSKTAIENELKKLNETFEKEKDLLSKRSQDLNLSLDEQRKTSHILKVLEVKTQEADSLAKKYDEELKAAKTQLETLVKKEAVLKKEGDAGVKNISKEKEGVEKALKAFEKIKTEIADKEKGLESEEEKLKKASEHIHSKGIQFSQLETMETSLLAQFNEQFPGLELKVSDTAIDKLEKEIRTCKNELENYKDVNLAALETLDQYHDRKNVLTKDLGDLHGTKGDLLTIIEKLKGESRTLFFETFEKVRANFKKNFAILFSGGDADLELTSQEDLLKAGVEIHAKPPGKQMRSINLLSGGEKCLTALALLFAIFEVKASPFCILDEIDAPLDDTNVGRFVEMVKHFKDRTQFIVITHNKKTMGVAEKLYGVSMEEKGVSKILMMEFQKKEAALV